MEKIKSHLTTAYLMFVFEFADPSSVKLKQDLDIDIGRLFDSQRKFDFIKRKIGREELKKAIGLHLGKFQSSSGLDHDALLLALAKNRGVYTRYLGKDKVTLLKLIASLLKDLAPPKRGLLSA